MREAQNHGTMSQGSTGNVIAALASFFIPGLGQLLQGRILPAVGFFLLSGVLWFFLLGWLGHILATIDAAVWKPRA
jgi:TM2 domain-containing membrane protein YozV